MLATLKLISKNRTNWHNWHTWTLHSPWISIFCFSLVMGCLSNFTYPFCIIQVILKYLNCLLWLWSLNLNNLNLKMQRIWIPLKVGFLNASSMWWGDRNFNNTAVPFTTFLPEESLLWESKVKKQSLSQSMAKVYSLMNNKSSFPFEVELLTIFWYRY